MTAQSLRERLVALADQNNGPNTPRYAIDDHRDVVLAAARMALTEARAACKTTGVHGQICYVVSAAHADEAIRKIAATLGAG